MVRDSSPADRRSLREQLEQDDVIEIEEDHGAGVTAFIESSSTESNSKDHPGFPVNQDARKEGNAGPGLLACDFPGTPVISSRKKTPKGEEEEEMENEDQRAEPDPVTPPLLQVRAR